MALFGLVDTTTGITQMLQEDHRRVETLFEEFKNAGTAAARRRIAMQAIQELKIHAAIEEKLFYPALRKGWKVDEAADKVGEAYEEHHVVKLLIGELERQRAVDDEFKHKFSVLSELVVHHAKEEEKEMFPAAESAELDLERLGEEAQQLKKRLEQPRAGRANRGAKAARGGRGNKNRVRGAARSRKPAAARKK